MKKIISILLAVMLVASATIVAAHAYSIFDEEAISMQQAIADWEAENGETVPTYRYYFQMPDGTNGPTKQVADETGAIGDHAKSWIYEHNEGICGIYYWATGAYPTPGGWTGYAAAKEDAPGVYYADVPAKVLTIIWNNGVDGGQDESNPLFFERAQTDNLKIEYLDPGEDDDFPDGIDSFNNMIFIVDPDKTSVNEYSGAQTCGGRWYYYLGDGCYTDTPDGDCVNPDHHHGGDTPTEAPEPTDAPLPTDAPKPTEAPGPAKIVGDVDGDGVVSVLDATKIQKYKAQLLTDADLDLSVADVDGDGTVSVMDATRIQKYKAQLMNLDGSTPYVG